MAYLLDNTPTSSSQLCNWTIMKCKEPSPPPPPTRIPSPLLGNKHRPNRSVKSQAFTPQSPVSPPSRITPLYTYRSIDPWVLPIDRYAHRNLPTFSSLLTVHFEARLAFYMTWRSKIFIEWDPPWTTPPREIRRLRILNPISNTLKRPQTNGR